MSVSLYGEARRLRYFFLICELLLKKYHTEYNLFLIETVNQALKINDKLKKHKRATGVLRTVPVAKNYLIHCEWLNLLVKESYTLISNGYTKYLGNISKNDDFSLITKEQISMFILLINKEEFLEMLAQLKSVCAPKDFITSIRTEHFVESFLEWCLDLNILKSTSKKLGKYLLSSKYSSLANNTLDKNSLVQIYCTAALNKKIQVNRKLSDNIIWKQMMSSLNKTANHTRSEFDNNLFSVLPTITQI